MRNGAFFRGKDLKVLCGVVPKDFGVYGGDYLGEVWLTSRMNKHEGWMKK